MDDVLMEKLKRYKGKKYIYGAGNLGQYLNRKLTCGGIDVDGYIVDGRKPVSDLPVYSMEEIICKQEKSVLIIGFAEGYARLGEITKLMLFDDVVEFALPFEHHAHFNENWVNHNQKHLIDVEKCLADELSISMLHAFVQAVSRESVSYVRDVFDFKREYFYNDIIKLGYNESLLEIGAFEGKSIIDFVKVCDGKYKRIIAIEPDEKNYMTLEKRINDAGITVELHNIGCWHKHDFLKFDSDDKISRLSHCGASEIEVDAIDNIVGNKEVSIVNLGVSVAQREILMGAKKLISNNKPKMVIFLGSANKELWEIPILLKEIRPDYKLFMRFSDCMPSRFFLFAI